MSPFVWTKMCLHVVNNNVTNVKSLVLHNSYFVGVCFILGPLCVLIFMYQTYMLPCRFYVHHAVVKWAILLNTDTSIYRMRICVLVIPTHQITNIPLCNVITVNHQISHWDFTLMLWVWLVNLMLMASTSITLNWWLPIGVSINVVDHRANAMLIFSWITTLYLQV